MDLPERVQRAMAEHALLKQGETVLIGVSGGLDSMVLLHLLQSVGERKLHVAHFNHCLRGTESDSDETFVQAQAEQLGLPFVSDRGDVKRFADENGISIEMAARELRHRFLIDSAMNLGVERIALAHHADDQIETFWLRLLRGDVGPGLTGMRWIRPAGGGAKIQFIRPLLEISKADLVSYAKKAGVPFREDSSNSSPEFLRNRLRLELIARLKTFQPALREVTLRTAKVLSAEKDFLEQSARHWLEKRTPAFGELHPALQREVMRVQLLDYRLQPNYELIETLRTSPALPVTIGPNQTVTRAPNGDVSLSCRTPVTFSAGKIAINLESGGRASFETCDFEWEFVHRRGERNPGVEYLDAGKVGPEIVLRHWRRGDRFHPIGMPQDSKLQDLFTNWKVPAAEKRRRLLATDSTGKIFWVEGLRISELHKVTAETTGVLRWSWERRL